MFECFEVVVLFVFEVLLFGDILVDFIEVFDFVVVGLYWVVVCEDGVFFVIFVYDVEYDFVGIVCFDVCGYGLF